MTTTFKNFSKHASLFLIMSATLGASACKKNSPADEVTPDLEVKKVVDLDGTAGTVYVNLATGEAVAETSTNWDIAFNSMRIILGNGAQAQIVEGVFDNIILAPDAGYSASEIAGSGSVYTYTGQVPTGAAHAVLITPGRVIVVKTHDNNYAKIELVSYYQGNPDTTTPQFADLTTRPKSRYYSFDYVLQPDGSKNLK